MTLGEVLSAAEVALERLTAGSCLQTAGPTAGLLELPRRESGLCFSEFLGFSTSGQIRHFLVL